MLLFIREVRVHNKVFTHLSTNQNTTQRRGMLSSVERFVKGQHFVVLLYDVPIEREQLNGLGFSFERLKEPFHPLSFDLILSPLE